MGCTPAPAGHGMKSPTPEYRYRAILYARLLGPNLLAPVGQYRAGQVGAPWGKVWIPMSGVRYGQSIDTDTVLYAIILIPCPLSLALSLAAPS